MELEYSPRHAAGLHLLSPSHHHSVDGFATIRQIRRSLSRSPSKPSRYSLYAAAAAKAHLTSPPSAAAAAASTPLALPRSPSGLRTALTADASSFDARLKSARTGLGRPRPRRVSPNSPLRRALGDSTNHAYAPPRYATRHSVLVTDHDQENMDCSEDNVTPAAATNTLATPTTSHLNTADTTFDEPIKIDFSKPGPEKRLQPVLREHASPMKSSPLKRSDGLMNLEAAHFDGSRSTKRRSLHGASLGADFNIFDSNVNKPFTGSLDGHDERSNAGAASAATPNAAFEWTSATSSSPQRRPVTLRKSTLQQRNGPSRNKMNLADVTRDVVTSPTVTASRTRPRVSLDGNLPLRNPELDTPVRRHSSANDPPVFLPPPAPRQYQSAPKPHPLSHAQTPSSFALPPTVEVSPAAAPPTGLRKIPSGLSKSLPLGALRPSESDMDSSPGSQGTCATPAGYQFAKPLPRAFMSTGLISKQNRHMDTHLDSLFASTNMPDTPSKKATHLHLAPTPAPSALGRLNKGPAHEFGTPTPFNAKDTKIAHIPFGAGIFGSRAGAADTLRRRSSFLSIDGDDSNPSPTHQLESQSSNDDLPLTPTKSTSSNTRPPSKGKNNSLRSSIFGRRASMGPETFALPADTREQSPSDDDEDPSPIAPRVAMIKPSPHTPHESLTPPDPSRLSISAEHRASIGFNSNSFPPATPTGPRFEASHGVSMRQSQASSGYFANDVDTALTSRFSQVTSFGVGEFSQVYKVEKPLTSQPSVLRGSTINPSSRVWAVKKSRRPYTGVKDRQRKMQEVQILRALRGNEHIVELVDDWESKNFLYIQTEFCENGNLKDFLLQAGFKGRLDDFRIWKILLELAHGVQSIHEAGFIHLDIKPANVFIDWEGVLKIGDFGMASSWPAPAGIDGEGDREYIGPEVLSGCFDKPADIFSLGMVMLEIAGNIVLPDNGTSWQRLRAGDMSDLPSLTWSSDNNLIRDESGDPIDPAGKSATDLLVSINPTDDADEDDLSFLRPTAPQIKRAHDLVAPPNFMVDPEDAEALDHVVQWMIRPDPSQRPTIVQLLTREGVRWVSVRRRAGATVYEGNYGPADDVLRDPNQDVEMMDM